MFKFSSAPHRVPRGSIGARKCTNNNINTNKNTNNKKSASIIKVKRNV
jgi:hypothetical protein